MKTTQVVMVWALALAGCGGDKGETTEGGSSTGEPGTTVADDTSTGGTSLDPTTAGEGTSTGEPGTTLAPTNTGESDTIVGTSTDTGLTGTTAETDTGEDLGPMVDLSEPMLHEFEFGPQDADPEATEALGIELAELDTTVTPLGKLVVYLHGAGQPGTCGSKAHGRVLAAMGYHVVQPCYRSDYGVGNCGDDIGGCRLEAFEGVDHHDFIDITPPNSIETRVVKALELLQAQHPGGDWQYFIADGQPRWSKIVVSGISHGASSSGLIAKVRHVDRAVMLSGPLDSNQAWLSWDSMTPIERYYAFTHTGDEQHDGHLGSFAAMGLLGEPAVVDGAQPPYGDSHRLVSSAPTNDGHGSTQAGGASPKDGDAYVFQPVWDTMYGVTP